MSLVIAVKNKGVVYIASDTQYSAELFKTNPLSIDSLKILKMKNNTLVAGVGDCNVFQKIVRNEKLQEILQNNDLTKEMLVKKYISTMIEILNKQNLLIQKENETMENDCHLLIAKDDKLFYIKNDFSVYEIEKYVVMGCAMELTYSTMLNIDYEKDIQKQILKAIQNATKYNSGISSPFCCIDTKTLQFEFKEQIL